MNIVTLWRVAATIACALGLGALLSGCVLGSKAMLVQPDEAVELLPASFDLAVYTDNRGGVFSASADQPGAIGLKPGTAIYADHGKKMEFFFVPRSGGTYLIVVANYGKEDEGQMFGIARYRDNIVELSMLLPSTSETELQAAGVTIPDGATATVSGITVADRTSLDTMLQLIVEGRIATAQMIAWVGTSVAPTVIRKRGDWYTPD